jgi:hypothetical protein
MTLGRIFELMDAKIGQWGKLGRLGGKCSRLGGLLCIIYLLSLSGSTIFGATINAASPAAADVQGAVNSASDGDTVVVPAGSATWSTEVKVTKAITLQGAGTNSTIITTSLGPGLSINSDNNGVLRVTGFTFNGGNAANNGPVTLSGNQVRLDSCLFTNCALFSLYCYDAFGVVDHCTFVPKDGGPFISDAGYGGQSYGDGSWTNGDNWGTANFIFFEDDRILATGNVTEDIDCCYGARFVVRHCTIDGGWSLHGTDSTGRPRGVRAIEVYQNTFNAGSITSEAIELRSGTALIWSNTFTGSPGYGNVVALKNFRSASCGVSGSYPPWGACNGSDPYDGNTDANGYPAIDQCGRGQGTLLTGSTPTPVAWPNEVSDPVHVWGNTLNSSTFNKISACGGLFIAGRDYTNAPLAGYTPYVYPHPLTQNGQAGNGVPDPPTGFRVVTNTVSLSSANTLGQ